MVWRDIPGYEGHYQVSDAGEVRSLDRYVAYGRGQQMFRRGVVLKQSVNRQGYLRVALRSQTRRVHALVLEAFVGPRPEGADTLHANDIRTDNRLENLSWGTRRQNMLDAVKRGRHGQTRKTHCKWGHEFTAENTIEVSGRRGTRKCRACRLKVLRRPLTPEQRARKTDLQRARRAERQVV